MTRTLEPVELPDAINDARAAGDWDAALVHIAPESLDQGKRVTREDWRRRWESMRAAVPDLEIIREATVADGEWIANRYTVRGTHVGDFFGQPPTGRRFEIMVMDMVRVRDGQLLEHWAVAPNL